MPSDNPNHRPIVAAIAASCVMLAYGLTYHVLAWQLAAPASATPLAPEALERLPMQIVDWIGEDLPMDEAIVRATGTDAHINRGYSRKNGLESISAFVGCSAGGHERVIHRPEICYTRAGWTLTDRRSAELSLGNGGKLPCSIFQFSRGELITEKVTALHYYIVDGQSCDDLSPLKSRLWRLGGTVNYVARVLIVAPNQTPAADSATRLLCDFAVDSGPYIARLFENLQTDRGTSESLKPLEGN